MSGNSRLCPPAGEEQQKLHKEERIAGKTQTAFLEMTQKRLSNAIKPQKAPYFDADGRDRRRNVRRLQREECPEKGGKEGTTGGGNKQKW